ncbi:MAG: hypothetical protein V3U23_06345, partial [Kiloniellales bacterium]
MEALPITPAKASHQAAEPQAARGLGDVYRVLLHEASLRLDARPSLLASIEAQRATVDSGRAFGPRAFSSVEPGKGDPAPKAATRFATERTEAPQARTDVAGRDDAYDDDNDVAPFATEAAPEPAPADETSGASEEADGDPKETDGNLRATDAAPGEPISTLSTAPSGDVAAESAETTGVAAPVLPVAAEIAAGKAQALGAGEAAFQALARVAAQPQNAAPLAPQA